MRVVLCLPTLLLATLLASPVSWAGRRVPGPGATPTSAPALGPPTHGPPPAFVPPVRITLQRVRGALSAPETRQPLAWASTVAAPCLKQPGGHLLELRISPAGRIQRLTALRLGRGGKGLVRCVDRALRKLRFPEKSQGSKLRLRLERKPVANPGQLRGLRGSPVTGAAGSGKAPPRLRAGQAVVGDGPYPKAIIRRVIRLHRRELQRCYRKGIARDPTLQGRLLVRFVIGPQGKVTSARVQRRLAAGSPVGACIAARIKGWRFPAPRGGGQVVITYPFVFRAAP